MKRELALGLLLTVGCTANTEGDAKDDSFGGSDVKFAFGAGDLCQRVESERIPLPLDVAG